MKNRAFTLIEIMIAVAVVGLLTTFSVHGVLRAVYSARTSTARQDLARLAVAVETLAMDTGCWPGGKSILLPPEQVNDRFADLTVAQTGLRQNPTDVEYPGWRGPYIDYIPLDPWGQPYFFDAAYRIDGTGHRFPVVGSRGGSGATNQRHGPRDILHSLEYIYTRTR